MSEELGWKSGRIISASIANRGKKNNPLITIDFQVGENVYPYKMWLTNTIMRDGRAWSERVAEIILGLGYKRESFMFLADTNLGVEDLFEDPSRVFRVKVEKTLDRDGKETGYTEVVSVSLKENSFPPKETHKHDFFLKKRLQEIKSQGPTTGSENTSLEKFETDDIPF